MLTRITVQPVPVGVDVRRCPECDHSNAPDPAFAEDGDGLIMRLHSAKSCYECGAELTEADLDPEFTIGSFVATGLCTDGEE